MLLLFCAHAPRTPQLAAGAHAALGPVSPVSAYFRPRNQPSCRADDSPSMSVLLRPSPMSSILRRLLAVSTALQKSLLGPPGKFKPSVVQTTAFVFDRVTAK